MIKLRKIIITILSGVSSGVVLLMNFSIVNAAVTPTPSLVSPLDPKFSSVDKIFKVFADILYPLVGLILFIMVVYGGVTKLTAAGDPEKEKKAMGILKNSLIGAAILALSAVIVNTIAAFLNMQLI